MTEYGKRYRCEPIEESIKRTFPGDVIDVHLFEHFTLIELETKFIRFATSAATFAALQRYEATGQVEPGPLLLGPVIVQ
jgi:hypothetical protein